MSYTMYTPLNVWLDPASVTDVVAYIQTYLSENTIYSETEIETIIHDYLIAHPELIGGVQSVNGKTGTVVLSASDINTANNVTIESVLASLSSQISSIAASVATNTANITSLTGRMTTAETDLTNLKSNIDRSFSLKTDTNFLICTNTTSANNAAFGNGFVATEKIHISNIDAKGADTIRVRTVRDGLYIVSLDGVSKNASGTFDVDFDMLAGDELYIVWQTGTIYYSGNTGNSYKGYSNYQSGSSVMTVNYLVAFNVTYESYDTPILTSVNEILKKAGKRWLAIGDSITNGQFNSNVSYVDYVTEFLHLSTIKEGHNGYNMERLFIESASFDPTNSADIVSIFAGTNDFTNSRVIGNISDTYGSNATFYGVLNGMIPYYLGRYPTKPLILMTPLQRNYTGTASGIPAGMINSGGIALIEYAEAIKNIGVKYGLPVIDLYSMSGFSETTLPSLTVDGLHPNTIGHKLISNVVAPVINERLQFTT